MEAVQEALAARPELAARSRFVRFDDVTVSRWAGAPGGVRV